MVGLHFCERLIEAKDGSFQITLIGDEPYPAYDRVNLSKFAKQRDAEAFFIREKSWYEENQITTRWGHRVTALYPEAKSILIDDDEQLFYDELVLATGSRAFIPPVDGADLSEVFPYRSLQDVQEITAYAEKSQTAAVIGGGLLGLEAAELLTHLGVRTTVLQLGDFLMSAQLNQEASHVLRKLVEASGISVFTNKATESITRGDDGQLTLRFKDGTDHTVDMVVISAGITPNTEIAEEAGLHCGVRGGVVINDDLSSSEEHVYAIGECALHGNQIYGLVAPGYEMAAVLAKRLTGHKKAHFTEGDLSTRLKMVGIDVVTIGDYLDPRGDTLVFKTEDHYRVIALSRRGRVIGGMAVGEWAEASAVQYLRDQKLKLTKKQRALFLAEGVIGSKDNASIADWPDKQLVCNCLRISKGQLCTAMEGGATTCALLREKTGASSVCGSCEPLLQSLVSGGTAVHSTRRPWLITVSALALVLGILAVFFKMPFPQSVETLLYKIDELWRDSRYKQITGYTVAGISIIGTLMSLRKRVEWLHFLGKFANWRMFHTVFGLVSLFALFSHTGFRFGQNLNFWLMFSFIGLNLLGAVAGIAAGLEANSFSQAGAIARRFRPALTYAHIILFWPFPVLLGFHIFKSYHW